MTNPPKQKKHPDTARLSWVLANLGRIYEPNDEFSFWQIFPKSGLDHDRGCIAKTPRRAIDAARRAEREK